MCFNYKGNEFKHRYNLRVRSPSVNTSPIVQNETPTQFAKQIKHQRKLGSTSANRPSHYYSSDEDM
jgi:hypothetical protein